MNIHVTPTVPGTDLVPLAPLGGSTDAYWFANGIIAYYSNGSMSIHASATDAAIVVDCKLFPVIKAIVSAMGLPDDDAIRLAYTAEQYGRQSQPTLPFPQVVTLDLV